MVSIDNLTAEEKVIALQEMLLSRGWKLAQEHFVKEKKEALIGLVFQTSPATLEGVNNLLGYQAMYHAIDEFFQEITDWYNTIKAEKDGNSKGGL